MIEWIVTSSALILLVLLLRLLVRDRVSPRLRYALWGLVLLRLVIPVSLWESPASVLRAAQVNEGYQLVSTLPDNMSLYENGNWRSVAGPDGTFQMEPDAAGRWEVNQPRLHNAYGWVAVPSAEEARALRDQGQKAVDTAGLKRLVDVQNVLRVVWQAGIWLFMLFLAAVNGKFALDLRRGRRPDGEYRGRPVFIMEVLPTPCLFGLFRPGIYLTPGLGEDEKPHVLAHEYAHFRQGDHIWAVLRGVCLALHWYNPLVWLAAYLNRRDCELSCDEGAVRLLGEENRADYGRTLVGLVARRTTAADLACCATTMTGGKSALKERIALLVKRPQTTAVMAVLVAAACIVFAACTFTGAAEPDGPEADPAEPVRPEEEPRITVPPEELPALEELPTRVVSPGTPEEEGNVWLLSELQEDGVAVYYEPETNRSWLRYGEALQALDTGGRPAITPRMLLPELYFQDLDGDGEKELAMICHSDSGADVSVWDLLICEWDGRQWTAYPIDAARTVIDDFNASRSLTVFRDTGSAEAGYLDSAVTVDLNAIYREQGRTLPPDASLSCALDEDNYGYMMHRSGQIFLHINGAVRAEDDPAHENNLLYTCAIEYQGDGVFKVRDEGLSTWYPYFALTPAFREILLDFIQERQEAGGGEDISADRFAVRDVNGDGRDELIIQTNAAPMAGQVETVYDGDGNTLLSAYPFMTYYDNGCAKAGWSHNHGVAGNTLWPYTLLKYDEDAGKYVRIADVDGWDKSIRDTYLSYDESVIPFPDEVDKDGDGFVYYIIEEEGGYAPVYGEPMDYGDYALWADRYLGGNVVRPGYFSLSKENIALIRQ